MATAAPTQSLPIFYNQIEPLNFNQHGKMKVRPLDKAPVLGSAHAIPATVDEFTLLLRHYPIVFSIGSTTVPLALMGLNEGVNTFMDADGKLANPEVYVPAYMRRYPFLLARMREDSDELTLCVDPTAGAIGEFDDGLPLFEGTEPSDATKAILEFCEQFETAGQRTAAFVEDLKASGLLIDGEVAIQPEGAQQPFLYRGFLMVDEDKIRQLPADEVHRMNQNGMLALIYAHLFSLSHMRDLFARQVGQGKGPMQVQQPAEAAV